MAEPREHDRANVAFPCIVWSPDLRSGDDNEVTHERDALTSYLLWHRELDRFRDAEGNVSLETMSDDGSMARWRCASDGTLTLIATDFAEFTRYDADEQMRRFLGAVEKAARPFSDR